MDVSPARNAKGAPADCAVLRLVDVAKRYVVGQQTVNALDGVSFGVSSGEFLAIMGASGSGKSTLLNILGCLDRPSEGAYWLNGVDVAHMGDDALSDHRLYNLGFVFQSFHLIPQLTVAENIALPLFYRGADEEETEDRVRFLAESVGIWRIVPPSFPAVSASVSRLRALSRTTLPSFWRTSPRATSTRPPVSRSWNFSFN